MAESEMSRAVKVFDWVILAAAVLCIVYIGMGLYKKGQGKHSKMYSVGLMVFILGVAVRNLMKNKSWK